MSRSTPSAVRAAALLVCLLLAPSAASAALEGRWRLVHQSYGDGEANLADREDPLYLEVVAAGGRLTARLWRGGDAQTAVAWPAFVADAGPLPVEELETALQEESGLLRARYRVRPSPGDDLILEVTEEYRLLRGGRALEGTLEVRFTGGKDNRGGFVLHRRFERAP